MLFLTLKKTLKALKVLKKLQYKIKMMDPKFTDLPQICFTDMMIKINIFDFLLFSKY